MKQPRFKMGRIVATPGALHALEETGTDPQALLRRHVTGDWGDLCEEDRKENEFSIEHGFRLLSSYLIRAPDAKVWIITEADRSSTTLLLPSEY